MRSERPGQVLAHGVSVSLSDRSRSITQVEQLVGGIAQLQARQQLLKVPWSRFESSYEQYPNWLAISVWIGRFSRSRKAVLRSLGAEHRRSFKIFLERIGLQPLELASLEWVHNEVFSTAKKERWLDALIFYGVRHCFSQCALALIESPSPEKAPTQPPPVFQQWWNGAKQNEVFPGLTATMFDVAIRQFMEWDLVVSWLTPLAGRVVAVPAHVIQTLQSKYPDCPAVQDISHEIVGKTGFPLTRLLANIEDHLFAAAKTNASFEHLSRQVACHPHYLHLEQFAMEWLHWCRRNPLRNYPSFSEWRAMADDFTMP